MVFKPTVSVILTCYNHEAYIAEAVESILKQTYNDFELIIIDDGSTDDTLQVINKIKDARINLFTQKNSGTSMAINEGIQKSRGKYIALMSGDDISKPNRLDNQINQINKHQADIVFCLPEIIGPHSEKLNWATCQVFFGKEFKTTAELYRIFFENGNFLCAPSAFLRRSAIEQVGLFKRGLIQLQDFDYWIRACKKNLLIKLFKDPLIQYRYLFGKNLSDARNNINRIRVETLALFSDFFDNVPNELFCEAFKDKLIIDSPDDFLDIEIEKINLLMNHSDEIARLIGSVKMVERLDNDEIHDKLIQERAFNISDFFKSVNLLGLEDLYPSKNVKVKRLFGSYLYFLQTTINLCLKIFIPSLRYAVNEVKIEEKIKEYLEKGEDQKAISLARGIWSAQPKAKIRDIFVRIRMNILTKYNRYKSNLIRKIVERDRISVYPLAGLYTYARQNGLIVEEYPPERVYLHRPHVVGQLEVELPEGEAFCPRPFVAELNDAMITGDANLIISHDGILLNDELVDFPSEEYGIKSHYIKFRHQNKVLLTNKRPRFKKIRKGILISCDHSFNYFHWLVETLPKLLLVDSIGRFNDVPLLIPNGLHENLEAALMKVNINGRHIIRLQCGEAYKVKQLIYPSALSRVLDHYKGKLSFNTDIVLSHKWVYAVSKTMRLVTDKKPWRKLFLTRRKGIRSLSNLQEVEQLLFENQYEIVELDGLSINTQVTLFSQASVVIAPSGAALTNMLFCRPGTKVIALTSNHELTNYYLWSQVASIAGLDLTTISGQRLYNITNIYAVHDDYIIDLKILDDTIKSLEKSKTGKTTFIMKHSTEDVTPLEAVKMIDPPDNNSEEADESTIDPPDDNSEQTKNKRWACIIYLQTRIKNIVNLVNSSWRYPADEANIEEKIKYYLVQGDEQKAIKLARRNHSIYPLAGIYTYARQNSLIVEEYPPERVYLHRPHVVGQLEVELPEGEAFCPKSFVAELNDAIITGDANLIISHNGILLNDELVDFPSEEYGIKSHYIKFRHQNKVLLTNKRPRFKKIRKGILISCDHSFNYFHWLVETLPKLLLVDSIGRFNDVPLLIPNGLHENLEAALMKVNINGRHIIRLQCGEAYKVKQLIYPSALSRVLDHYKGKLSFNTDIVLSHKWVYAVSKTMRLVTEKKPWRKLFLTRRKGIRSLGNLQEIEQLLFDNGYEIIELEGLSMNDQITLFSQASVVIAPSGAALTNMLFCRPGTKVIALTSNHELTNYYLWSQVAGITGLDLTTISGQRLYNITNIYAVHDDYIIDLKILKDTIQSLEHSNEKKMGIQMV